VNHVSMPRFALRAIQTFCILTPAGCEEPNAALACRKPALGKPLGFFRAIGKSFYCRERVTMTAVPNLITGPRHAMVGFTVKQW
jgi:hypothetical protein